MQLLVSGLFYPPQSSMTTAKDVEGGGMAWGKAYCQERILITRVEVNLSVECRHF